MLVVPPGYAHRVVPECAHGAYHRFDAISGLFQLRRPPRHRSGEDCNGVGRQQGSPLFPGTISTSANAGSESPCCCCLDVQSLFASPKDFPTPPLPLSRCEYHELLRALPTRLQNFPWRLTYDTAQDGFSLQNFYRSIEVACHEQAAGLGLFVVTKRNDNDGDMDIARPGVRASPDPHAITLPGSGGRGTQKGEAKRVQEQTGGEVPFPSRDPAAVSSASPKAGSAADPATSPLTKGRRYRRREIGVIGCFTPIVPCTEHHNPHAFYGSPDTFVFRVNQQGSKIREVNGSKRQVKDLLLRTPGEPSPRTSPAPDPTSRAPLTSLFSQNPLTPSSVTNASGNMWSAGECASGTRRSSSEPRSGERGGDGGGGSQTSGLHSGGSGAFNINSLKQFGKPLHAYLDDASRPVPMPTKFSLDYSVKQLQQQQPPKPAPAAPHTPRMVLTPTAPANPLTIPWPAFAPLRDHPKTSPGGSPSLSATAPGAATAAMDQESPALHSVATTLPEMDCESVSSSPRYSTTMSPTSRRGSTSLGVFGRDNVNGRSALAGSTTAEPDRTAILSKFGWSGSARNKQFVLSHPSFFGIGGGRDGAALFVDQNLHYATSSVDCSTFNSPPLFGHASPGLPHSEFVILRMVWFRVKEVKPEFRTMTFVERNQPCNCGRCGVRPSVSLGASMQFPSKPPHAVAANAPSTPTATGEPGSAQGGTRSATEVDVTVTGFSPLADSLLSRVIMSPNSPFGSPTGNRGVHSPTSAHVHARRPVTVHECVTDGLFSF